MKMKVVLVHDWLTGMRGGEKVLEKICEIYSDAPLYTMIHISGCVSSAIESRPIYKSLLQYIPCGIKFYRHFLPIMPLLAKGINLKKYDMIISTSHCVAKNIKPSKSGMHICYCHTPMRYIWDMFDDYFSPKKSLPVYLLMQFLRPCLRYIDVLTSKNVTYFIANSKTTAERIRKYYNREAEVIYPPVDTGYYTVSNIEREEFYLIVSSLVPYKKVELAVNAFNANGKKLKIIGFGPELKYLKRIAKSNIEFLKKVSNDEIRDNYRRCKALIFPGKEDFGIVPVEAMACGAPVITYGEGGATETVIDGKTGVYFMHQTVDYLNEAINRFEAMKFDEKIIRNHSEKFSEKIFPEKIKNFIEDKIKCCQL